MSLVYSCMHMSKHCWYGRQLLNASKAHACYFPHQAVLHVATCSTSAPGSCPGLRQSCEAMVNIVRNVWRGWEGMYLPRVKRKFRTYLSLVNWKSINKMCLQLLYCNCTIAILEEQDVLQDYFSLSFALKSGGQTSPEPQSSKKQPPFPFGNSL